MAKAGAMAGNDTANIKNCISILTVTRISRERLKKRTRIVLVSMSVILWHVSDSQE